MHGVGADSRGERERERERGSGAVTGPVNGERRHSPNQIRGWGEERRAQVKKYLGNLANVRLSRF